MCFILLSLLLLLYLINIMLRLPWTSNCLLVVALTTISYASLIPKTAHGLVQNNQVNHLGRPLVGTGSRCSATRLHMAVEEGGLGAARAMLFNDQHKAMGRQAEDERELLENNMSEMKELSKKKRKQHKKKSAGVGFGAASPKVLSKFEEETQLLATAVQRDGVVLVPGVLQKETAATLRKCVLGEVETMRDAIRTDPSLSVSLFYVPADIHFSTPRGYVLLPFRDTESVKEGPDTVGPMVEAARELLSGDTPLSGLFGEMCDGANSQMYDFCALRTEPGAARQVVHSDTPHQEIPGLFCAFIALQDVTMEMGGTMFFPKTHTRTAQRKEFDSGDKLKMLKDSKPQYTMLKAGDAAFFDMRTLHAGLANLPEEQGGAERVLMAITFRNLKATGELGHKPNLRPGYVDMFTLGELQEELSRDSPFQNSGNGLLPGIGDGVLL